MVQKLAYSELRLAVHVCSTYTCLFLRRLGDYALSDLSRDLQNLENLRSVSQQSVRLQAHKAADTCVCSANVIPFSPPVP